MKLSVAIAVALLASAVPASISDAQPADAPPTSSTATFEGSSIDLTDDWNGATACLVTDDATACFGSEVQLDAALADALPPSARLGAAPTCSTTLRLYAGTSHSSRVLVFSVRGSWKNLSSYGFDNTTRSYRVGACAARLAGGSSGGGGFYPGSTSAGASATSMVSGWDRAVSSVYLY